MSFNISSINHRLSKPTLILKINLWVLILISIVTFLILILISTLIFIVIKSRKNKKELSKQTAYNIGNCSMDSLNEWDIERNIWTNTNGKLNSFHNMEPVGYYSGPVTKYSLEEIYFLAENNGFSGDGSRVFIKNLCSCRTRVERFSREAKTMCLIRHENLVKIVGYCAEEPYRILVYEHVDNGNLNEWLHQNEDDFSPLTWNIRMKIIKGIAEGLAYLHQGKGNKPAIVHQNLKSSNILLDEDWNPKITNFAIARLFSPGQKPSIGMSGYLAPEYNGTSDSVNEKVDVYSFGVLIMEIISGKITTFTTTSVTEIEETLVNWINGKIQEHKFYEILDPRLLELPSRMELEKIVDIALQCVDSKVQRRPTMRDIIDMLEPLNVLPSPISRSEASNSPISRSEAKRWNVSSFWNASCWLKNILLC